MVFLCNRGKRTVAWQQKLHFEKETKVYSTIFNNVFSHLLWQRIFQTLRHELYWYISCPSRIRFLFYHCKTDYKLWASDIYISLWRQTGNVSYMHCKCCCSNSLYMNTDRDTCEVNNKKRVYIIPMSTESIPDKLCVAPRTPKGF